MWKRGFRDEIWSRLDQKWDLIIVGGGITGAGILGEATRHGKKALLVEANDFASGTSSRSTKLVHGGLRYLRQGQFLVTRKSVKERERLMEEGAGLVDALGFTLTTFPGDKMPRWMVGMGLAMYDALAWKWAHEAQSVDEIMHRCPELEGSGVIGGYRYFDAQTDDARLVMRVLKEAVSHGGTAINYVRAESLLRTKDGQVRGVVLRDNAPGSSRTIEVQATVVINATGAWADDLRKSVGGEKRLRKIRGSHICFDRTRLPLKEALSLLHPRDARAVFAVPWEGVVLLGTTDVDHGDQLTEEPNISADEFSYILEAANRAFPSLGLTEKDVVSTFAGVRSVIDTGAKDPSKESREHAIWKESGLLTITGGKLTTFALMARDVLAEAEEQLGGLNERSRVFDESPQIDSWPANLSPEARLRLVGRHGKDAEFIASQKQLLSPIGDSVAVWAELLLAAREEAVVTLSDLLLRRVRLGLMLREGGMPHIDAIRKIAQPELGWDDARWDQEVAAYKKTWTTHYGVL